MLDFQDSYWENSWIYSTYFRVHQNGEWNFSAGDNTFKMKNLVCPDG
jgi:hypothetical protein